MMTLLDSTAPFNDSALSCNSAISSSLSHQHPEPNCEPAAIAIPSEKKAAQPAPSRFSPWLLSLAYPLGRYALFPLYFGKIEIQGQELLPQSGSLILAPTHRSRWDAMMVPFVAGHHVTGRHLRFMVSADEMMGIQGWFIRRMGGFPINTKRPAIASLRHGVDLLEQGETLVIFPEGNIYREHQVQPIKPGLARLAIQAETYRPNLDIRIVPITIRYSSPFVPWRSTAQVRIGQPLNVKDYITSCAKQDARKLTAVLQQSLEELANNC